MVRNALFASLRAQARSTRTRQQFSNGQRRWASTPSSSSSSSSTGSAQQKVNDAFASAQKGLEKATEVAKKIGGGVGDRVGALLGSYREPLVYNLSVAREILKQVYIAERLQPPTSFSAVTSAYSSIFSRAYSPSYWREVARTGEWKRVGIYAVEAYGIFKIGEILGRRSLVGYNLE